MPHFDIRVPMSPDAGFPGGVITEKCASCDGTGDFSYVKFPADRDSEAGRAFMAAYLEWAETWTLPGSGTSAP